MKHACLGASLGWIGLAAYAPSLWLTGLASVMSVAYVTVAMAARKDGAKDIYREAYFWQKTRIAELEREALVDDEALRILALELSAAAGEGSQQMLARIDAARKDARRRKDGAK